MKSPKRLYLPAHVNLEIPVALAVAGGRHAGDGLEHPVEMGQIGKPVSRLISVMFLSVSRNMRWAFMIRVTLT